MPTFTMFCCLPSKCKLIQNKTTWSSVDLSVYDYLSVVIADSQHKYTILLLAPIVIEKTVCQSLPTM